MTLNLEEDNIGVVLLGPYGHIKEGALSAAPDGSWRCRLGKA